MRCGASRKCLQHIKTKRIDKYYVYIPFRQHPSKRRHFFGAHITTLYSLTHQISVCVDTHNWHWLFDGSLASPNHPTHIYLSSSTLCKWRFKDSNFLFEVKWVLNTVLVRIVAAHDQQRMGGGGELRKVISAPTSSASLPSDVVWSIVWHCWNLFEILLKWIILNIQPWGNKTNSFLYKIIE